MSIERADSSQRYERITAITVACVAVGAAVLWFLAWQDAREFRQDIDRVQADIREQANDLRSVSQLTRELLTMQQNTDERDGPLASHDEAETLLDAIRRRAVELSLTEPEFEVAAHHAIGPYRVVPVTLRVAGESGATLTYLHELEQMRPTVQFDRVHLETRSDPAGLATVHLDLGLRIYFSPADPGDGATLSADTREHEGGGR
ncbi:MAG: type 4a pilus biogenesis protein PilO [Phycisphaeraceae bacterium]